MLFLRVKVRNNLTLLRTYYVLVLSINVTSCKSISSK